MPTIKQWCKCNRCAASFRLRFDTVGHDEAEYLQGWVKRECDLCTDCYKEDKRREAIARASDLLLPSINGESKKQEDLALMLRDRYIKANIDIFIGIKGYIQAYGLDDAKVTLSSSKEYGMVYLIVTTDNAKQLIDSLKRF